MDRWLARTLNSTIITLIAVTSGVGLTLGYRGLLTAIGGDFSGLVLIAVSVGMTVGAYHLCRHRQYLADC